MCIRMQLPLGVVPIMSRAPRPKPAPRCRHCEMRLPWRGGLCRRCYDVPDIRAQYEAETPRGQRPGKDQEYIRPPKMPPYPTAALPHSTEKMQIMRDRVSEGYAPCHPLDGLTEEEVARATTQGVSTLPFFRRLSLYRLRARLSQRGLAKRSNIPLKTIQHYEHGYSEPPVGRVRRLAEALGVDYADLAAGLYT